jgi:xylulokinase
MLLRQGGLMGPPSQRVVLGLDISTTATKAILVRDDGTLLAAGASEYGFEAPEPLWIEQDPRAWWVAATEAIRAALSTAGIDGGDVQAIGLCGQMHGLVLLDAHDEVLRPAILWNDQRTLAECDEIRERVGRQRLIAIAGCDALASVTAPKLLWVRRHEPAAWARARRLLLPKDYVRLRLTGEHAIDASDAAGTLLFDLDARAWSAEIVEALGLDGAMLPRVLEGPDVVGTVTPQAAQATGLRSGTPVIAGAGDQAANAIGVGAVMPGATALSLGTSGVVFVTTAQRVVADGGQVQALCHALPDRWHLMGVTLSAAGSLKWLRETLAPGRSWDELTSIAAGVPPGAEGLLFLPFLTGDQTVHPDPLARAAFVGLNVRHGLAHLVRAVLEGVAFSLVDVFTMVAAASPTPPRDIRASGGGTRSFLWNQILADVMGMPLSLTGDAEAAARGAAVLAAVAAGWFRTVPEACDSMVRLAATVDPGVGSGAYGRSYDAYQQLYPALRDPSHRLSGLSGR